MSVHIEGGKIDYSISNEALVMTSSIDDDIILCTQDTHGKLGLT